MAAKVSKRAVADALRTIKKMVQDTHWVQRNYFTRDKKEGKDLYCMVGLINHVTGFKPNDVDGLYYEDEWELERKPQRDPKRAAIRRELIAAIQRNLPPEHFDGDIEEWNDAEETTREDVLDVVTRATREYR